MGIPIFSKISDVEYNNSLLVSNNLKNKIIQQHRQYEHPDNNKHKSEIRKIKQERINAILGELKNELSPQQLRLIEINQETDASSWLTALPLKDEGYIFTKQSFWFLASNKKQIRLGTK